MSKYFVTYYYEGDLNISDEMELHEALTFIQENCNDFNYDLMRQARYVPVAIKVEI